MASPAIRIDLTAPEPISAQILRQVKESVAAGRLSAGDRLPSVRELARALRVNPNTVVRAYDALERDGVIVRRQGAGCFVSDRPPALAEVERRRRLRAIARRAATEAYHLGFGAAEIAAALDAELGRIAFPDAD